MTTFKCFGRWFWGISLLHCMCHILLNEILWTIINPFGDRLVTFSWPGFQLSSRIILLSFLISRYILSLMCENVWCYLHNWGQAPDLELAPLAGLCKSLRLMFQSHNSQIHTCSSTAQTQQFCLYTFALLLTATEEDRTMFCQNIQCS